MMHSGTRTGRRGQSQKFSILEFNSVSPYVLGKGVWMSSVWWHWAVTGVRLCGTIKCLGWGENLVTWILCLSRRDYSQWGGTRTRGLRGKQPILVKSRQALMPNAGLWIKHFPGDPCITWHMRSRCYVCREDCFNLTHFCNSALLITITEKCFLFFKNPEENTVYTSLKWGIVSHRSAIGMKVS